MIITIDGPAGSGKSTVAKLVAKELGFVHFNSGSLFRGITAFLHENNFNFDNISIESKIPQLQLETKFIGNIQHVYVNGKDYTSVLRTNIISQLVPSVAANKSCRKIADNCQRVFASKNNTVVEGRDTGSHVFPKAEFKFYLDCSIEERANRRFLQEKEKNPNITLIEIKDQIKKRDEMDKNREIAPLVVPRNAIIVDSTNLSIEETVSKIMKHIS